MQQHIHEMKAEVLVRLTNHLKTIDPLLAQLR